MSQAYSISAKRQYGLARVCRVWKVPRSTVYARRSSASSRSVQPKKRGPLGGCSDLELVEHIKDALAQSPWVGEGYRKTWARLRASGVRVAARRVLRVMRENNLQSPRVPGRPRGPIAHDRSIIPEAPDQIWGTDMTATMTGEGMASIFFVIDHLTAECLGVHAANPGTRFEALEALRQAVRSRFGTFDEGVASTQDLKLRHDHGSQFVSHVYQEELRFLGIESSPAYVREPQGNGCAERFVRTMKEQLLWLLRFDTITELNKALHRFKERYNTQWLIERHGWRTPRQFREDHEALEETAA